MDSRFHMKNIGTVSVRTICGKWKTFLEILIVGVLFVVNTRFSNFYVNCKPLENDFFHYNESQAELVFQSRLSHCSQECQCNPIVPKCQDGVPLVIDGCGCCPVCARQQGDVCSRIQVCDTTRKLQCTYNHKFSPSGICRVRSGQGCRVGNSMYSDAETFKLDCRTQCTCQNGTYGCVSLCPHEKIQPSSRCQHPQLVQMSHDSKSCCREWVCQSTIREDRASHCQHYTSEFTPCSATCGMGFSTRISNQNPECMLKTERRLCLLRPCEQDIYYPQFNHGHHVRKNRQCRATVRSTLPIRFTDGPNCTSLDSYQPKYCGICVISNHCCVPHATTTKRIPFHCMDEEGSNVIEKDVLWIIKCSCEKPC